MLLQAHRQVVECRRILKWTYAYGYYKFDTLSLEPADDASPAEKERLSNQREVMLNQKAFFEFLQVCALCRYPTLLRSVSHSQAPLVASRSHVAVMLRIALPSLMGRSRLALK